MCLRGIKGTTSDEEGNEGDEEGAFLHKEESAWTAEEEGNAVGSAAATASLLLAPRVPERFPLLLLLSSLVVVATAVFPSSSGFVTMRRSPSGDRDSSLRL